MVVDSNEIRCLFKEAESTKEVGPQFRVISMLLKPGFHRCDLLLYRENTDIVQDGRVHQVGLRTRIESHCMPKLEKKIIEVDFLMIKKGSFQSQEISCRKNQVVEHH